VSVLLDPQQRFGMHTLATAVQWHFVLHGNFKHGLSALGATMCHVLYDTIPHMLFARLNTSSLMLVIVTCREQISKYEADRLKVQQLSHLQEAPAQQQVGCCC
jgi:hypothetical protein